MRILKYLAIFLLIIIISLPFALKQGMIYVIKEQGAQAVNIDSVSLNLFTGKLQINGLHVYGENNQGLHFDTLLVDIALKRLINKQAFIEEVLIRNFKLDVVQSNEKIRIAGLALPTADEKT